MVLTVIMVSVFCASAEPEETIAPEVVATEVVVETEVSPTEIQTEPQTEPPVVETEAQPESQPETEAVTEPETEAQTDEPDQQNQETYASTQAVTHELPKATVETIPTAIAVNKDKKPGDLTYGFASWACVVVGILVVVIVLISNKTQARSGSGKHRYDEGNKITGQKRLLNDDYYNHRKTESYYNKDTRK